MQRIAIAAAIGLSAIASWISGAYAQAQVSECDVVAAAWGAIFAADRFRLFVTLPEGREIDSLVVIGEVSYRWVDGRWEKGVLNGLGKSIFINRGPDDLKPWKIWVDNEGRLRAWTTPVGVVEVEYEGVKAPID